MTIDLPVHLEKELEQLAVTQGRNLGEFVEEAIRRYIETASIGDLDCFAVGETQVKLVEGLSDW